MRRSDRQLDTVKAALDRAAGTAGTGVYGWYVDPDASSTRIAVTPAPRLVYDLRGGDQYVINGNVLTTAAAPSRWPARRRPRSGRRSAAPGAPPAGAAGSSRPRT
ncbi:S1 family peptidase [Microbispora sp. H11081]|uniref:S1 family peptidase n=1 Tax=Microbispora sp. H11081 TaxID=2729107 RepID=UPI001B8D1C54|nr:S1 family peptidase [Microbispora sp. H11081]